MEKVDTAESSYFYGAQGSNPSRVRHHNERLLLSFLRTHEGVAKAEIARSTGLSAQTVSNIMRQLEVDGLIVKGEPMRGRVGQPSVPISLAADGAYFWGLKLGRRSAEMVLINFVGKVIGRERRTYAYPTPEGTVAFARHAMDAISGRLSGQQRDRIAGLGIAMPFQIWRWAKEIDVAPEKMAGWTTFDVAAALSEFYDGPVFVRNDASAACGAELVFGEGPRPQNFLYFYIGYFIGGGVVLDGQLLTGPTGNAGATGPLPVAGPNGEVRQLLDVASLSLLERALRGAGQDAEALWRQPDTWKIPERLVSDWIDTTAGGLADAIRTALCIIDFEAILIDGWMPLDVRGRLVEAVGERMALADLTGLNTPEILEGTVGPDARAFGAASLPLSHRFLLETRLSS